MMIVPRGRVLSGETVWPRLVRRALLPVTRPGRIGERDAAAQTACDLLPGPMASCIGEPLTEGGAAGPTSVTLDPSLRGGVLKLMLTPGMTVRCAVNGFSMSPMARNGDIAEIEHCEEVAVGDIVLYLEGDRLVMHRVVRMQLVAGACRITTKGDGLRRFDPPLPSPEAIIGRVRAIYREQCIYSRAQYWHRLLGKAIAMLSHAEGTLHFAYRSLRRRLRF